MVEALIRLFTTTAADFEVLYLAATDLLTGNNPYLNPFIFTGVGYPPNTLLFYLPFTFFPYQLAQNIFTLISVVSLFFSVILIYKLLNRKLNILDIGVFLGLALISFPTKFTLGMGQNNFLALFLLVLSLYFYDRKNLVKAGIFLGLAFALKTIFVYFLIIFLAFKQWKVIGYSLLTFLLTVISVVIITGSLNLYSFYFQNIVPPLLNYAAREVYYNQGPSGFISRIFSDLFTRKVLTSVASVILVVINFYLLLVAQKVKGSFYKLVSLTVVTLLLIDSLAWQHHFVWLLLPFTVLINQKLSVVDKVNLFFAYILISVNLPNLSFLRSHVFLGNVVLYALTIKYLRK